MMIKMTKLGILIGVAALAVACGKANETADAAAGDSQTFSEAAGELESDVAGDVSAGADAAAQAGQDATDAAKKEAAADLEEGIKTE
jgi:hypothetical protein